MSFYSHEKIIEAKKIIFDVTGETPVIRRGDGKIRSEVNDIVSQIRKNEENSVEMPSFVADSYKSVPPSAGFEVLAEHVVHLVSEVSDLKEEVKSLKELNSRMGKILDMKEDIHDVKCMLVKVLPQRSSSTLPSNGNNNVPNESKSVTGTDRELDSRKGEKGQKLRVFNVNSEVMDKKHPLSVDRG